MIKKLINSWKIRVNAIGHASRFILAIPRNEKENSFDGGLKRIIWKINNINPLLHCPSEIWKSQW